MADIESKDKIIAAINNSEYKWRTPKGIAQSTGIEIEKVLDILDTSGGIVQARNGNAKGEPLFTTAKKYKENTGLASRVLSAITNKIVE
jgi:hypothetical protein